MKALPTFIESLYVEYNKVNVASRDGAVFNFIVVH